MAEKPYVRIYNLNNPPFILSSDADDPENINDILPHDVEIGTVAIVADDSGHRYVFDPNKVWKPYTGGGNGGSIGNIGVINGGTSTDVIDDLYGIADGNNY